MLPFLRGVININFTLSQISMDCYPALLLGPFFWLNLRDIITYVMRKYYSIFGVIAYSKLAVDRDMLVVTMGFIAIDATDVVCNCFCVQSKIPLDLHT